MAREVHSETMKIQQHAPITDTSAYDGDIVTGERIGGNTDYLDDLAFNEEPVVIRLEPSSDKNAASSFPVWCNGQPAQIFERGAWREMGYLPIGVVLTVKRKIVEIIARAKIDTIHTRVQEMGNDRPVKNTVDRATSPTTGFSIIEDRNPRGAAWIAEIRRRNL